MAAPFNNPGDQDLIRDRQNRLLEEQQRRLEELKDLPGERAAAQAPSVSAEGRCFPIETLDLKGADSLPAGDRTRLVAPYIGQCLGAAQLNELLKVITDQYIAKGLVTSRAYLPQQDLSTGHLQVLVVEGRLEGLKAAEGSRLSPRELAMAFPGRDGELLNLRDVEQLVDQLNRLPSNQAKMQLTPGQAVGGSVVQVENTPQKPWRAGLSRSNDGQKSTGEQQWGASLEWDSSLGLAEYGVGLGYDLGAIANGRYNAAQHGRMSSDSIELFTRGRHVAASVTFAHSLERPDVVRDAEAPVYFRLDFFL